MKGLRARISGPQIDELKKLNWRFKTMEGVRALVFRHRFLKRNYFAPTIPPWRARLQLIWRLLTKPFPMIHKDMQC